MTRGNILQIQNKLESKKTRLKISQVKQSGLESSEAMHRDIC